MKEPAKESDFYMIKNEKKSTQMFSSEGMFTEKVYPYLKRVRDVLVPGKRRMMYATMYPSFSFEQDEMDYAEEKYGAPNQAGQDAEHHKVLTVLEGKAKKKIARFEDGMGMFPFEDEIDPAKTKKTIFKDTPWKYDHFVYKLAQNVAPAPTRYEPKHFKKKVLKIPNLALRHQSMQKTKKHKRKAQRNRTKLKKEVASRKKKRQQGIVTREITRLEKLCLRDHDLYEKKAYSKNIFKRHKKGLSVEFANTRDFNINYNKELLEQFNRTQFEALALANRGYLVDALKPKNSPKMGLEFKPRTKRGLTELPKKHRSMKAVKKFMKNLRSELGSDTNTNSKTKGRSMKKPGSGSSHFENSTAYGTSTAQLSKIKSTLLANENHVFSQNPSSMVIEEESNYPTLSSARSAVKQLPPGSIEQPESTKRVPTLKSTINLSKRISQSTTNLKDRSALLYSKRNRKRVLYQALRSDLYGFPEKPKKHIPGFKLEHLVDRDATGPFKSLSKFNNIYSPNPLYCKKRLDNICLGFNKVTGRDGRTPNSEQILFPMNKMKKKQQALNSTLLEKMFRPLKKTGSLPGNGLKYETEKSTTVDSITFKKPIKGFIDIKKGLPRSRNPDSGLPCFMHRGNSTRMAMTRIGEKALNENGFYESDLRTFSQVGRRYGGGSSNSSVVRAGGFTDGRGRSDRLGGGRYGATRRDEVEGEGGRTGRQSARSLAVPAVRRRGWAALAGEADIEELCDEFSEDDSLGDFLEQNTVL